MHAATDRLEFAPPPASVQWRAIGLAVLAHAFLLAALTWGVHWKREAVSVTAEAELWSALPQTAAPRLVNPPPEPPPPPRAPPPVAAPPQPIAPLVDIALEREKLRLKKKQELDRQKELEQQRREKLNQEKLLQDKRRLQDKREQDKKALEDKKKSEQEAKRKDALKAQQETKKLEALREQQETKKLEAQRQANLQRMAGLAGASGVPGATGSALQSSGPSAGYAGRIRARIKPNIVFTEAMAGNPMADVEVRTSPDGTIISRKLLKSSGVKAWDDAVLKAIDKTEVLPRDVDGRVPPVLEISFRPKD